jgi:hypothetical protein
MLTYLDTCIVIYAGCHHTLANDDTGAENDGR